MIIKRGVTLKDVSSSSEDNFTLLTNNQNRSVKYFITRQTMHPRVQLFNWQVIVTWLMVSHDCQVTVTIA